MNYQTQINAFVDYFRNAESSKKDHKIGVEFEHFVVHADLSAVSYYEKQGIEDLLKEMSKKNWKAVYEAEHLVALNNNTAAITIEPGGQLEISINPFARIEEIEDIYISFLKDIIPILNSRDQKLLAIGYQPKDSIRDIPLLPKKRYKYMYKYFEDKGQYAHNMMKGTASLQLSIDYVNEKDYIKKMRTAFFLTPIIYYLFDNTPYFEGKIAAQPSMREKIWSSCDSDRSGIINNVFEKEFAYSDYAKYLLNMPPILTQKDGELIFTGDKLLKEVMTTDKKEEIEHFLSMAFPDVRTKKYIEIRSADALPYPYNFSYIAFLKGIFCPKDNVDQLYKHSLQYNQKEFLQFKEDIINNKENKERDNLIKHLISLAENSLPEEEKIYLTALKKIYNKYGKLKNKTLANIKAGKDDYLDWCILTSNHSLND
ncbi:glutamate-cysteine ligase family protein [Halanaerobium hydrogeniformans]|uniref:Glutamate--cysteine ligase n=1 Tax=Halanaerobium hydrogeniformans TaxID=656519 RepID=E4RL03_HALHG|nr:glutamate-cysteine ligase family protein [Halanaerobium hydrogeniformans]ADQ15744.1 Glutamate--cysteine ligase [Halanaerobium hydrogeniformans]